MNNITENDYLELAKHSKEMYEKQETIIKRQLVLIMELKKQIISTYGFVRCIDDLLEELIDNEIENEYLLRKHPVQTITEILRSNLSRLTESFITP